MAEFRDRLGSIHWVKFSAYLTALLIAVFVLFLHAQSYIAEPYIKRQINSAIGRSSSGFQSQIDDLQFSFFSHQVQITGLRLNRTDSTITKATGLWATDSLTIPHIQVDGIQYLPLLLNRKLVMDSVSIIDPYLKGYLKRGQETSWARSFNTNRRLFDYISPRLKAVQMEKLSVKDFRTIALDSDNRKRVIGSVNNLNFDLLDIRIDSSSARQVSLLPTSHFGGFADRLSWHPIPGLYDLSIRGIAFSSQDSIFSAGSINLSPRYKKYDFSRHVGHEIDRISLTAGNTRLDQIKFDSLLQKRAFIATMFSVRDARLEVFHDKKQPLLVNGDKTFPHLLFRQIDFPIRLDSIRIHNADIYYSEHHNLVPEPGTISFENTNATIKNVFNDAASKPTDSLPAIMKVTSEVQGRGHLQATFTFPHDPGGFHQISGSLDPVSMRVFNQPLKYLARVELDGGKLEGMSFEINLDSNRANGIVNMRYTGLDVEVIDFNTIYEKNNDKLKSFIANRFLIKKENTPPLREGKISYRRNPQKSIFNYWWKSLLSGLKSSVGL